MLQNPKGMQLSQGLLFDKYTYSFCIIDLQFVLWSLFMFNQLAGRLDLAKSSILWLDHAINSRRLPATGDHQR